MATRNSTAQVSIRDTLCQCERDAAYIKTLCALATEQAGEFSTRGMSDCEIDRLDHVIRLTELAEQLASDLYSRIDRLGCSLGSAYND